MKTRILRNVIALMFCFCTLAVRAPAATDRCSPPAGLDEELSKQFVGMHVVSAADLSDYDRRLYRKDHGQRCPGLVKVDFYGDGKPTWAVVLISGVSPSRKAKLLVARQEASTWKLRLLEETDDAPVVWRQRPGRYEGMNESKPLQAKNSVVVFCGYGSWAVLYAWTGSEVKKIWLSD